MDANQVWQAALTRISQRVSPGAFATWFRDSTGLTLDDNQLTIGACSAFASEHLGQRFRELSRIAVSEVLGRSAQVNFIVLPAVARAGATDTEDDDADVLRSHRPARSSPRRGRRANASFAMRAGSYSEPHVAPAAQTRLATGTDGDGMSQRVWSTPLFENSGNGAGATGQMRQVSVPGVSVAGATDGTSRLSVDHDARMPNSQSYGPASSGGIASAGDGSDLHPRYVFETFVVGSANRLAYAAAHEVARAPGGRYNPLLLYGGVGLGKTHLLHAIGHQARAAGLSVAYVTAERFTNEIIEAIRARATDEFRRHYRAVDVLLVDDVQFIAGREATEEEFFHTFNTLHEANKQIVLSSDCPPNAMSHLHDRLRSRFAWGLVADVQPPDFEHRLAILRAKANAHSLDVPESILMSLARPPCESIRALEGALTRVIAQASMLGQPIGHDVVSSALAPITEPVPPGEPLDQYVILRAVAEQYRVSIEALRGKGREKPIAWARQIAMYLLREQTELSLLEIGAYLGGRDHSTIVHGCNHVGQMLARDKSVRAELSALVATLRGE